MESELPRLGFGIVSKKIQALYSKTGLDLSKKHGTIFTASKNWSKKDVSVKLRW